MFLQTEEEKKSKDIMNDWWYDRAQNVTTSTAAIHETIIFVQKLYNGLKSTTPTM
jgi:hypothetical protein